MVPDGEAFKYFGPIPDIYSINSKREGIHYSVGIYEFFQKIKKNYKFLRHRALLTTSVNTQWGLRESD